MPKPRREPGRRRRRRPKPFTESQIREKISESLLSHLAALKIPPDRCEKFLNKFSAKLAKLSRLSPGTTVEKQVSLFVAFREWFPRGSTLVPKGIGSIKVTLFPDGNVRIVRIGK